MSTKPNDQKLAESIESKQKELAIKALNEIAYTTKFNPFFVMKNGDHEIRHSNTLAWLFDKKDNHGFDSNFAVKFFSKAFPNVGNWKEKFDGEVIIDTEVSADPHFFDDYKKLDANKKRFEENEKLEQEKKKIDSASTETAPENEKTSSKKIESSKKIDILIIGENFTITIENKYGSTEHDWQCQRYRYYINNRFEGCENYFVFLDIKKPDNWDIGKDSTIKNLKYEGYELITYRDVRDILKELVSKAKENTDAINYINCYIEVLGETYNEFSPETTKMLIENLKYGEYIYELKDIHPRLKDGKRRFESFSRNLQVNENEPKVKDALTKAVKVDFQKESVVREYVNKKAKKKSEKTMNKNLIQYHFGSAGVTDPYAYKLSIGDYFKNEYDNYKLLEKTASCINEIDYKARFGFYSIAFLYGITTPTSRKWCNEAYKNFDAFRDSIKLKSINHWNIRFNFQIYNGYAEGSASTIKKLSFMYTDENLEKMKKYWEKEKTDIIVGRKQKSMLIRNNSNSADEDSPVLKMLKDFFPDINGKPSDEYLEIKNLIEEYFITQKKNTEKRIEELKNNIIKYSNSDKTEKLEKAKTELDDEYDRLKNETWAMTFRWILVLEKRINDVPITTKEEREEISSKLPAKYIEITKEGLNTFKLGDDFVANVFKPN